LILILKLRDNYTLFTKYDKSNSGICLKLDYMTIIINIKDVVNFVTQLYNTK